MSLKHFLSGISFACLLVLPAIAAEPLQPRGEVSVKGGTDRSLLTTEFWAPIAQERDRVLYGDIRLMGDNDENREGNLGIGYRQIHKDAVLGGHAWIDRRRTQYNSTFHQLTFGVERLGHVIDVRTNAYIPLNNSRNMATPNIGSATPYLAGSGIFYDTNGLISETPQYGLDGELGYRVPMLQRQLDALRVYGGGYHFFRNNTENVTGFRVRTEAQVNQIISVGARYQYDEPRGSQGFLEATLKFPFSAKKLYQADGLRSRLDESPERDVDIVTASKVDTGQMKPVINTATGQVQRVINVDNSNGNTGDGTKENPYNTLKAAEIALQDNDIIYINHGTGTTAGMNQGIVINKANVSLIGSGTNFVWDGSKFSGSSASAPVNGMLIAAATSAPVITNTTTPVDADVNTYFEGNGVFVLADNATIAGITVTGATENGIYAFADSGKSYQTLNVYDVTLNNNAVGGFYVHASGIGTSWDKIGLSNGTIFGNQVIGARINSQAGAVINSGEIYNSRIDNNVAGMLVSTSLGGIINNAILQNNTSSGNTGIAIYLRVNGDASKIRNATLTNNTTSNNANHGLYVGIGATTGSAEITTLNITNHTANNNTGSGRGIYLQLTANGIIQTANLANSTTNGNIQQGVYVLAGDARINSLSISNHISNSNANAGVLVQASNSTGIINSVSITNSTSNNNTTASGIGFRIATATGGTLNATLNGNTANGNAVHGFMLTAGAGSTGAYTASMSNNNALNNTNSGINVDNDSNNGLLFNVDLGGGTLGSTGGNRVFGNTGRDIFADTVPVSGVGSVLFARNNWWGVNTGLAPGRQTLDGTSTIDATNFLTTDPRP